MIYQILRFQKNSFDLGNFERISKLGRKKKKLNTARKKYTYYYSKHANKTF